MPFTTSAIAPTSDWVYGKSRLRWSRLGIASAADLDEVLEDAIGYVTWITGRYFSDFIPTAITGLDSGPVSTSYTPVPIVDTPELIRLFWKVVRMCVEQEVMQSQRGYVDTVTDDGIASFTAGPYSESRKDPTRRGEQKMLNSWPGLNSLLWQLMTDDRREYWNMVLGGANVPAFSIEEVDWGLIGRVGAFPGFGDPMAPTPPIFPVLE